MPTPFPDRKKVASKNNDKILKQKDFEFYSCPNQNNEPESAISDSAGRYYRYLRYYILIRTVKKLKIY